MRRWPAGRGRWLRRWTRSASASASASPSSATTPPACSPRCSASAVRAGCSCRSTSASSPRRSSTSSATPGPGCCASTRSWTAALRDVDCEYRLVIGEHADADLDHLPPKPWVPDEDATATINYTSGTTARPKGVQLTHRNIWLNATTFGWQLGITDRDVYLHTLPQFHCNGWGVLYAVTGMGAKHIIIRKIDGMEILRRVQEHGVTVMCGAPAVANMILDAAATWDGPIPGRGRVRIVCAGAPPPTKTIERIEAELGWEFIQIYGLTETTPL